MFEKIENKIKEIAEKIYKSNQSDQDEIYKNAKKIYELAIIYKFLSKSKQNAANTLADIGFDSNGDLDTTALLNHTGVASGFVHTWYDQSGNGNNAVQSTNADQPQIVSSGTVLNIDGNPAMQFDGSSDHMDMYHADLYGQSRLDSFIHYQSSDNAYILYNDDTGAGGLFSFVVQDGSTSTNIRNQYGSPDLYVNGTQVGISYGTTTRDDLHTAIVTNGVSATAGALETHLNSLTTNWNAFGISPYNGYRLNGKIAEMIFYNTDQSSNRTGIESNINTYYTIY